MCGKTYGKEASFTTESVIAKIRIKEKTALFSFSGSEAEEQQVEI